MIYVCPEKDCRVSEPCTPCICGMDKLKAFGGTVTPTPRVEPPAYHAALAGQGSGIAVCSDMHSRALQIIRNATGSHHGSAALLEELEDAGVIVGPQHALLEKIKDKDAIITAEQGANSLLIAARHADLGRLMEATGVVNDGVASPAQLFERCLAKAAEAERLRAALVAILDTGTRKAISLPSGDTYDTLSSEAKIAHDALEQSNG